MVDLSIVFGISASLGEFSSCRKTEHTSRSACDCRQTTGNLSDSFCEGDEICQDIFFGNSCVSRRILSKRDFNNEKTWRTSTVQWIFMKIILSSQWTTSTIYNDFSGKIIRSEEFPAEMMTGYTLPYDLFLLHFERQITRSCNKMGIVDGNLWDISWDIWWYTYSLILQTVSFSSRPPMITLFTKKHLVGGWAISWESQMRLSSLVERSTANVYIYNIYIYIWKHQSEKMFVKKSKILVPGWYPDR